MSSSEDEKVSKTVSIPTFRGKEANFAMWWPRITSHCATRKVAEALQGDFDLPNDPKDVPTDKEQAKLHKKKIMQNSICMSALTLSLIHI